MFYIECDLKPVLISCPSPEPLTVSLPPHFRYFMKEISSDGDVSTVDVIYPASPFFLATRSPEALKRMLKPVLLYASNATAPYGAPQPYDLAWAPHHLGVWPNCDLAADKQEQMPLEESGNLLLMVAAVVFAQGKDAAAAAWLDPCVARRERGTLRCWLLFGVRISAEDPPRLGRRVLFD